MKRTGMQKKTIFAIVLMVIITAALSAQQNADYFISQDGLQAIQFETPVDGSGTFTIFPVARNRVNARSPMGRGSYRLDGDGVIITAIEYLVRRVDNPFSTGDRIGLSPALIAWRTEQASYFFPEGRQQAIRFGTLDEQNYTGSFQIFPVVSGAVNTQRAIGSGNFELTGRSAEITRISSNLYQAHDVLGLSPALEQAYERLVTQALQTEFNEADFTVTLTSDQRGVIIQRYNGTARGGRIPATIQGMPVRQIANEAFSARRDANLTAIAIPEGVTSIGYRAFFDCGLLSVTLPQGLTSIGSEAFGGDSRGRGNRLGAITLPNSLTTIGDQAFTNAGLTEITIPGSVRELRNVFRTRLDPNFERALQGTLRGGGPDYGDLLLKTVTISEGVTVVDDFNGYFGLVTLNLPRSLREIGGFRFTGFSELNLPEGLRLIRAYAFQNCRLLTSITIPSAIIMGGAFSNLPELTSITFPASGSIIMAGAFASNPKLNLASQAALTEQRSALTQALGSFRIDTSQLYQGGLIINDYSGSPTQLTFPGSIMGIPVTSVSWNSTGNSAFRNAVTNVVFSEGIIHVGAMFRNAANLTSVTFPSTIREISYEAFHLCRSLTTVTIPASVQRISFPGIEGEPNDAFRLTRLNAASQAALRRVGYTSSF